MWNPRLAGELTGERLCEAFLRLGLIVELGVDTKDETQLSCVPDVLCPTVFRYRSSAVKDQFSNFGMRADIREGDGGADAMDDKDSWILVADTVVCKFTGVILLTVDLEVLLVLSNIPAKGVYSWHEGSFVVVYLNRLSVRFLHGLDPVKVKPFWRDLVALGAAWNTKLDRFLDQRGLFWWDSMCTGWRHVGGIIVTDIVVGDRLSFNGRSDELGRHGRKRLVHKVRRTYVGFLVWGANF